MMSTIMLTESESEGVCSGWGVRGLSLPVLCVGRRFRCLLVPLRQGVSVVFGVPEFLMDWIQPGKRVARLTKSGGR